MINRTSWPVRRFVMFSGVFASLLFCVAVGCGQTETELSTTVQPPANDSADAAGEGSGEESVEQRSAAETADGTKPEVIAQDGTESDVNQESIAEPNSASSDVGDVKEMADVEESMDQWGPDGESPAELAAKAFAAPPNAKPLSKNGRLWIDVKRERVYVDGYVAMTRGPLEMFACPVGTKEHESIVAVLARSREVHAALLAINATPGTPVRFRPEFSPPTGQVIRVYACWYDKAGKFQTVDARNWIQDLETEKAMDVEWVFGGSGFWEDPQDKVEHYQADSGDMICVSNFSSAMMDVAIPSSSDADSLRFVPYESKIPSRETPVRLVLMPLPIPSDGTVAVPGERPAEGYETRPHSINRVLDLPVESDLPLAK